MVRAGYKQTEVGEIPEDWEVKRIGDSCTIFGRIGFRGYTKADIVTEGQGAISLSPSNIQDGKLVLKKNTYISWFKWEESPEIKIESNDVLLVKTGSTVGKAALVQNLNEPATLNPQLVVLKKRTIEDRYLGYTVVSENFQRQLTSTVVGGALPTLSQKEVADYKFPCPKLPNEQKAIADALSDVDALICSLEKLIAKKRDMKTAAMQQLLTGKKRLPGFGDQWNLEKIEDLADVDIENLPSGTDASYEFKYISLEDVNQGVLEGFSEEKFVTSPSRARRVLKSNDILIATVRPNLKSHLLFKEGGGDWVCSTGFSVLTAKPRKAMPGFLFYKFFSDEIERQIEKLIAGSNYPAINSGDVRRLEICCPKVDEQQAIFNVLADIDAELSALNVRLSKTKAIKQGMMQELLTGRTRLV